MLIDSAKFESKEEEFAPALEKLGHAVTYSAGYGDPKPTEEPWLKYGARMMRKSINTIPTVDAVLCLNHDKDGRPNYIGGATFCEIAYAFEHRKKIFILNDLPEDSVAGPKIRFELEMFKPVVLHGKLEDIR
jgi:hypothetical protein